MCNPDNTAEITFCAYVGCQNTDTCVLEIRFYRHKAIVRICDGCKKRGKTEQSYLSYTICEESVFINFIAWCSQPPKEKV